MDYHQLFILGEIETVNNFLPCPLCVIAASMKAFKLKHYNIAAKSFNGIPFICFQNMSTFKKKLNHTTTGRHAVTVLPVERLCQEEPGYKLYVIIITSVCNNYYQSCCYMANKKTNK